MDPKSRTKRLVQPGTRSTRHRPQSDNGVHAYTRICKLRSAGKAYVQHTWTRPAGSMRWTDKQQAVPALLLCHRLTTCTKGDTHTHSIPFAHILQSLHVLVRPAIARHHPAPVHHVGAFLVPRIDTWYHQAHQAASSSRRRPGLNEMADAGELARPSSPPMSESMAITSAICAA